MSDAGEKAGKPKKDAGKRITVRVVRTKPGYLTVTSTSARTARIKR